MDWLKVHLMGKLEPIREKEINQMISFLDSHAFLCLHTDCKYEILHKILDKWSKMNLISAQMLWNIYKMLSTRFSFIWTH